MVTIYQKDTPIEKVTFDMVALHLNNWDNFEYEFENGDSLIINLENGNFSDIGMVKYLCISYIDYTTVVGDYTVLGFQYFLPKDVNEAAMVFLERLVSEDPSKDTAEYRTLINIRFCNSKIPKNSYEDTSPYDDDDIKRLALDSLRTHDECIHVFKDGNILRIANVTATEPGFTEKENIGVDCIVITYAEADEELSVDNDKVYHGITTEFFLKRDVNLAIGVFIEKLNSDNPKFITEKGKKLKDIQVYNTGLLEFTNHYDYLEVMLEPFWLLVFGKTPSQMMCGGIVGAHGDKGYGYRSTWEENDISYQRGMLLYLLTYTKEMTEDKCKSRDWVIDKYKHYLPMIEAAEKQILKDVYGIESK